MLEKLLEFVIGFLMLEKNFSNKNDESHSFINDLWKKISITTAMIMIGLVISVSIIYVTIQFGNAYNLLLSRYENEVLLKLISYALLIVVGYGGFFVFIKRTSKRKEILSNQSNQLKEAELQLMVIKFIEGFKTEVSSKNEQG